jgi:hypothetical protein
MSKLSFSINPPAPPKPIFPGGFRATLFIFIMAACSALVTAALFGG